MLKYRNNKFTFYIFQEGINAINFCTDIHCFTGSSVFRATFITVKVYNLKSHKTLYIKLFTSVHVLATLSHHQVNLKLLVETAVFVFALGMVPASYILCVRRPPPFTLLCYSMHTACTSVQQDAAILYYSLPILYFSVMLCTNIYSGFSPHNFNSFSWPMYSNLIQEKFK
jgi:hypothetical protein